MEERKEYLFRVSHPAHGETEVVAGDRYGAVIKAAHEWGLRWSTIARDCKTQLLGEHKTNRKKGTKNNAKADKKGHRPS